MTDVKLFTDDPGEAARALEDMDRVQAEAALIAAQPEVAKGPPELIQPEIPGGIAVMDPADAAGVPDPRRPKPS